MNSANRGRDIETNPDDFARAVLAEHGLPVEPISLVSGWSNKVWLAPEHVVRLSSGRFRDALAHECRVIESLSPDVPHAPVRFYGRVGNQEWLVQDRMTGEPLRDVWTRLDMPQRRAAADQLGTVLVNLHATPISPAMRNPWLEQALSDGGQIENAYHAPPESYMRLINAASNVPGVEGALIGDINTFIEERLDAFDQGIHVLVHGDLHFSNLLYDGEHLVAILDFEGARPAAPDQELDTLLRQVREPGLYLPPDVFDAIAPAALESFIDSLVVAYPALFGHQRLAERLEVYDALWHLVQLLHFPPGSGYPDPYGHLKGLVGDSG